MVFRDVDLRAAGARERMRCAISVICRADLAVLVIGPADGAVPVLQAAAACPAVRCKRALDLLLADAALLPVAARVGFPAALRAVALRADLVRVDAAADQTRSGLCAGFGTGRGADGVAPAMASGSAV